MSVSRDRRPAEPPPPRRLDRAPGIVVVAALFWIAAGVLVSAQPPADSPAPPGKAPAKSKTAPGGGKKADTTKDEAPPAVPDPDAPPLPPDESDDDPPLPLLDQLPVPTFADLVKGPPVDWIVLHSKKVLIVEPLAVRPGAKEIFEERVNQATKNPETSGNSEAARIKRRALAYIPVVMVGEDDEDLRLNVRLVAEIRYWDDLLLQGVDRELSAGRISEALQLLFLARDRDPNWPGQEDRYRRLLFEDGLAKFRAGRPEEALAAWEQLHARDPAYNRLIDEYGLASDALLRTAAESGDFRRVRFFLKRLQRVYPQHTVASRWISDLTTRAAEAVRSAQANADRPAALDQAELAAREWPALPQLQGAYQRAFDRWPRLRVGLVAPSDRAEGAWPILDHAPATQLTEVRWFAPARLGDGICRFESRWFREWEPTDLGFGLTFHIRDPRGSGATAPWLAAQLAARTRRGEPGYSDRAAATFGEIAVEGPDRFAARLRLVPFRPEALLATLAPPLTGGTEIGPVRYTLGAPDGGVTAARRTGPLPSGSSFARAPHEVLLQRFPAYEPAVRALLRGELSLLSRIPLSAVRDFQQRNEFFTAPYGVPETHILTFHPGRPALRNTALRRALLYSVPRQTLLEQVFGTGDPSLARASLGVVSSASYAHDRSIPPPPADRTVGLSLAIAARKELGEGWPDLVLWHPRGEEPAKAAAGLVQAWSPLGLKVTVVSEDERPDPGEADLVYRRVAMVEPLVEFWPFLAEGVSQGADSDGAALARLPVWLRRSLLELDTVGDRERAAALLQRLQRQIHAEALVIPLWEIQPHLVARKHLRGLVPNPLSLFQGIDRWQVDPWYAPE